MKIAAQSTQSNNKTLNPEILFAAYSQGYFPMPDHQTGEILWFRPDPRAIIPLHGFHVSRSLKKKIRKNIFSVSYNQAFRQVMKGCASHPNTWINDEFIAVYSQMHRLGLAHSVEIWQNESLVGGTYGIAIGGAFFAESMFHSVTDASKVALYYLVEQLLKQGFTLLECQFITDHLKSLGAIEIPDQKYIYYLGEALKLDVDFV